MSPARKPSTRRVDAGKSGHRYVVDGKDYAGRGVTTLLGAGFPKPAIPRWAAREVADAAVYERHVWLPMLDAGRTEAALDYLRGTPWTRSREAAARGTDVHHLAARLAQGEEVEVDDRTEAMVDAYLAWRADWRPTDELVEVMVINRRHHYAGTLDFLGLLHGLAPDGTPQDPNAGLPPAKALLDVKTGARDVYPESALQLAAYRNAETMLPGGEGNLDDERAVPAVDFTGVLWLHDDGTYDLIPVDTGPKVFRCFLYVAEVAGFMGHRRGEGWGDTLLGDSILPHDPKEPTP